MDDTVFYKNIYHYNDIPCAFGTCIYCICYKPAMRFLILFASYCFLLWPRHTRALLRAPQKQSVFSGGL